MRIRVTLKNPTSRRFYQAIWKDPITGAVKTQSTKTTVRRDAERFAARLEDSLNSGDFKPRIATTWAELRERYETEVSAPKAEKTRLKTQSMFNAIERLFNPKMISAVADASFISKYAAKLRREVTVKDGEEAVTTRKDFTIRGHLAELRKVLRWARDLELIPKMPVIRMPPKVAGMKGRPITEEEFDRMLACVHKAVNAEFVDRWKHFMRGMWLSSLRLEEAMKLHWTSDKKLMVDFSNRRPMFRIQAAHEKGRKFRLLPMTPDFAEFLAETPTNLRTGFVFNPLTFPAGHRPGRKKIPTPHRPTHEHAGRVISDIGKLAGVKVSEQKFASSHDFRRAFGYRWSKIVMPKVLQELMRHESIQTTMEFYVGSLAEDAADEVWRAVAQRSGSTSGNTSPEATANDLQNSSEKQ